MKIMNNWFCKRRHRVICVCCILAMIFTVAAFASGNGMNQWPGGRIPSRLDLHYGQIASNAPNIPLYSDSGCTRAIGHYLLPGDWVVKYPDGAITYPITVELRGGDDEGLEYTTHYIRKTDNKYVVSRAGNFSGTSWNTSAWYKKLPTAIGYESAFSGNKSAVWVGNNTDDFKVKGPDSNCYWRLWTGNDYRIMYATPSQFCFYDLNRTDYVNADYEWHITSQSWSADGLKQGTNTVYFAGMDASGNFKTGQRNIKWDTAAPLITTALPSRWFNELDKTTSAQYTITGRDDTSATKSVSGLRANSMYTKYDKKSWSAAQPFGLSSSNATAVSSHDYSVSSLVNNLGEGRHTLYIAMYDNASNRGQISQNVNIDFTPPTCTLNLQGGSWRSASGSMTAGLNFNDSLSGVSTAQYQWTGSNDSPGTAGWLDYSGAIKEPGSGVWYLHWKASDIAGNTSEGTFGPLQDDGLTVEIIKPNAAYLTGTDVITSVKVTDASGADILPSDSVKINFSIKLSDGTVYNSQSKSLICPKMKNNIIWFRWHTPKNAGKVTISANAVCSGVQAQSGWSDTLVKDVSVPYENTPPDTSLDDTLPSWFSIQSPSASVFSPVLSWNDWSYTGGAFRKNAYNASITAKLKITPERNPDGSIRVKTAWYDSSAGMWEMKSGYGINEDVTSNVTVTSLTKSDIDKDCFTQAQLTEGRYPEFNYWYGGYFRLFKNNGDGSFSLFPNKYGILNLPVHYTPVMYPDCKYTALATVSQAWTPAGVIGYDAADTLIIKGALPDDWYVRVVE